LIFCVSELASRLSFSAKMASSLASRASRASVLGLPLLVNSAAVVRRRLTLPLVSSCERVSWIHGDIRSNSRSSSSSSHVAPPSPSAEAQRAAEEAVNRLLVPQRVHDVFNPRLGAEEDADPSWISDVGKQLTEVEFKNVDAHCAAIHSAWRFEVAVVLLEGLPDDVQPSAFSAALLNYWGVGDKRLHTGLFILLLSKQRRLEMRVGYGADRALPKDLLRRIQEEKMVPHFKHGAIGQAFSEGLKEISATLQAKAPSHWRRDAAVPVADEQNRHGFGGGQTSIDEFMSTKDDSSRPSSS